MNSRFDDFNLLPAWYRERVTARRWKRAWIVTLGCTVPAAVAGVVLTQALFVWPNDRLLEQVRGLDLELVERDSSADIVPAISPQAGSTDPRETEPAEWGELLNVLATMSGGEIGFQRVEITISADHVVALDISGLAADSQGVLEFAATVERSGLFAPMNSPSITFEGATGSVRFELTAQIPAIAAATEAIE